LREWTKEELEKLKLDYGLKSLPELCKELGRSENAIRIKASRMGLKKFQDINPCFGKDFGERCVDSCPDWIACLDAYTQQIQDALEIEYRITRITVRGNVKGSQIVRALREALKQGPP